MFVATCAKVALERFSIMKTEIIRARVEEDIKKSFELIMQQKGLNASQIIRNFIVEYIEREQLNVQKNIETLDALEQVQLGNVIEGELVNNWLKTWGTENEQPFQI